MTNIFDNALHYLGQNKTNKIFVLNIGAMDGMMFDEMHGYTTMYNFRGLYVEPIPYLFEKLKNGIGSDNLFENSAISDYNGEIEMIMIDKNAIDNGLVHNCFYGMSAVYPPKNGLNSKDDEETVKKYGKLIKVPCITFETLMSKHNISIFDVVKIDAEGHDYQIFKQISLNKYKPQVIRLEWVNLSDEEHKHIIDIFNKYDYIYEILGQDITAISKSLQYEMTLPISNNDNSQIITLVTGLWNIGRGNLDNSFSRQYQDYLDKFAQLLDVDNNLIIFGDKELESFVWKKRKEHNTQFILRDLNWFKRNDYYDKIQEIRKNPEWYNQADWLKNSPQAKLDLYNPIVMSKMFLLNDARISDKFNSDYIYWIDAALVFTVHPGYFTHDKVLTKLSKYISKFTFIAFPYETKYEIHGFVFDKICNYANNNVNKVARGGFFGGPKKTIAQINSIYYSLLVETLSHHCMGTEESIFSIILYKYSNIVNFIEIAENGLLCKFFEDLKNDNVIVKNLNIKKLTNLT